MECYVLTLTEEEPGELISNFEHNVIGVYENKADIHALMMRYYIENQSNLEDRSMTQFENSKGDWVVEIKGRKENTIYTLKAECKLEKITASIKELLDDLMIII